MDLFLEKDRKEANKELDCYNDCMYRAIEHLSKGEFKEASIQHENMARSLAELQKLKNAKEQHDKAEKEIKEYQEVHDYWSESV